MRLILSNEGALPPPSAIKIRRFEPKWEFTAPLLVEWQYFNDYEFTQMDALYRSGF
jgi:hypothetical protein